MAVPEAKRDDSFPSAENFLERCHVPYRVYTFHKIGGSLIYAEAAITPC